VNNGFDVTLKSYPAFSTDKKAGYPKAILAMAEAQVDPDYVEELDI
jgi:hypothetical protein